MYKLQSKTVKGLSPLTINRTAKDKMIIYPHGYTYQKASEQGKNLCSPLIIGTFLSWTTGQESLNEYMASTDFIKVDFNKNPNYTFSASSTGHNWCIFAYNAQKQFLGRTGNNVTNYFPLTKESFTGAATGNTGDIAYVRAQTGRNSSIETTPEEFAAYVNSLEVQLEIGDIITDYEPFIPNMPSPKYPSPIRNVGDNINYYNIADVAESKTSYGITYSVKDEVITLNGTATRSHYIYLTNNKYNLSKGTYTMSTTEVGGSATPTSTGPLLVTQIESNNYRNFFNAGYFKTTTNTLDEDETDVINAFYIGTDASFNNYQIKIKLEKGKIATPWSPYGCGSVDFKVENRNLFNKDNMNRLNMYSWNGSEIATGGNDFYLVYIKCRPNTTYTVQKVAGQRFALTTTEEVPAIGVQTYGFVQNNTGTKLSITTPSNAKYLVVQYYRKSLDTLTEQEILDSIQIEEGTEATSYQEHQEQIVSFPMTKGQVLHEKDYLAEDGTHQKRKTIIFNGTENWAANSTSAATGGKYRWRLELQDIKQVDGNTLSSIKCTHYKTILAGGDSGTYYGNEGIASQLLNITIFDENYATSNVSEWKAYLAQQYVNGTPVTIEYELTEEIVVPYTEEQKEAYYQLQHLLMYEGYTSITCINEIKPDIQLTYYFNNEINNTYAKRIDSLEEKIRLLEKIVSSQ